MRHLAIVSILIGASSALAADATLRIPTDPKATYTILEVGGEWPDKTITTKRVGSSGTSYSKRLYNCAEHTVKYLGTGDTIADLAKSKPDPRMAPIVPNSIADYVGRQACTKK